MEFFGQAQDALDELNSGDRYATRRSIPLIVCADARPMGRGALWFEREGHEGAAAGILAA